VTFVDIKIEFIKIKREVNVMKMKLFCDDSTDIITGKINRFLDANPEMCVKHIKQDMFGVGDGFSIGQLLITVWYEDSNEG